MCALAGSAFADTCDSFSTFNCAKGTPDVARLGGGTAVSGSIGFVLKGTNQFTVFTANGKAASDVIIVAASSSALTGTVNGMSFTSLKSFPEDGAIHAISSSLAGLGFCSSPCKSLSFGYVDLHSALTANGSLNVTLNGVPAGTALYAMMVVNGKIKFITPNSEARATMRAAYALATIVLVGMHPVLMQVPPNSLRSITATCMPDAARRPASDGPAWPAPMTMAS